ncbi:heat shock factor binding protein 1-domain-containing protein [Ustulina deusta]|nr:heat shock factor binding protein 1-domain-containing protein [Ustulina deusta]
MSSKKQEENTTNNTGNSADELTTVVEELLNSLSNKFTTVSNEIFAKSTCAAHSRIRRYTAGLTWWPTVDEMSRRLDSLEAALRANEEKAPGSPSKT